MKTQSLSNQAVGNLDSKNTKYLLKFHDGQRRLNDLIQNSGANKFVVRTSRQFGKTTYFCGYAIDVCGHRNDAHFWYVAPYYKQCAQIFNNVLLPLLNNKGLVEKVNRSTMTVYFKSGSVLQFQSAENYEGLRGATITHLVCDEFGFFRPEAYEYALSPMMDVKGEMTFFVSTPKGLNKFYEYWNLAESGEKGWACFLGLYTETGNESQIAQIEEKRMFLPPEIFKQEYECAFISDNGTVFKDIDKAFILPDYGKVSRNMSGGIDLGQNHDRTVLCILNDKAELVYFKRFEVIEQQNSVILIKALSEIVSNFKSINILVEKNFNSAVFDHLFQKSSQYQAFITNNKTKNQIISNLQYYISSGLLKIPLNKDTEQLKKELLDLEMKFTKVRSEITYSAPNGGYDDCVISLALACWKHRLKFGTKHKNIEKLLSTNS